MEGDQKTLHMREKRILTASSVYSLSNRNLTKANFHKAGALERTPCWCIWLRHTKHKTSGQGEQNVYRFEAQWSMALTVGHFCLLYVVFGSITSQDCLLSMIFSMVSLRAWWTKGVAVAFMYCSIKVLARVVARNSVVASSATPKQKATF